MNTPASTASAITDEQMQDLLVKLGLWRKRKEVFRLLSILSGKANVWMPAELEAADKRAEGLAAWLNAGQESIGAEIAQAFPDGFYDLYASAAPTTQPTGKEEVETDAERDFDAEMAAADSGPPLIGRWHHGSGVLVSGGIRIAQWDCDTNPPSEFRERVLDWMCESLNSAVRAAVEPSHPAPDDELDLTVAYRVGVERGKDIARAEAASRTPAPAAPSDERVSQKCMLEGLRFQMPALQLTGHQLLEALDFLAPDRDEDQMESTLCVALRDGGIDMDGQAYEAGLCCWLEEYPEEGSLSLEPLDPAAIASSTKASGGTAS